MDYIFIHGKKVLVDIVHLDSMEEPESACTNRLISARVGEKTYHRLSDDPLDVGNLVREVADDLTNRSVASPDMITVVVASFAKSFSIDWPASVSSLSKMQLFASKIDLPLEEVVPGTSAGGQSPSDA